MKYSDMDNSYESIVVYSPRAIRQWIFIEGYYNGFQFSESSISARSEYNITFYLTLHVCLRVLAALNCASGTLSCVAIQNICGPLEDGR
jgi:hypothetical protein